MNLSSGFIVRPVATVMMIIAVTLLGVAGYTQLPVAALPTVDTPTIQVTASLPGADPQTMVSSVVTPLERQFGQIAGLQQMTSSAGTGPLHDANRLHLPGQAEPPGFVPAEESGLEEHGPCGAMSRLSLVVGLR
jgi:hypothetical protein